MQLLGRSAWTEHRRPTHTNAYAQVGVQRQPGRAGLTGPALQQPRLVDGIRVHGQGVARWPLGRPHPAGSDLLEVAPFRSQRGRATDGGSVHRRRHRLLAWYRLAQVHPHEHAREATGHRVCVGDLGEATSLEKCTGAHVRHCRVDPPSFVVHRISLDRRRTV